MGLFDKVKDKIAEETAAWDESSQALSKNEATRQRKQEKQGKGAQADDKKGPAGDGGAGAIASIIAN